MMGDELGVARRFGENLRRVRRQADLSQEELGFRASLHRSKAAQLAETFSSVKPDLAHRTAII